MSARRVLVALALALLVVAGALVAVAQWWDGSDDRPTIERFHASVSELNQITLDWDVDADADAVYIYEDVGPLPRSCPDREPDGCSTSFRVGSPGTYTYTLSVEDAHGQATSTVSVEVAPLPSVTFDGGDDYVVRVDELHPEDVVLRWHPIDGPGHVRVTAGPATPPRELPPDGSFTVPAASLSPGTNLYRFAYCETPPGGGTPLCAADTSVGVEVGGDQLEGDYRRVVEPDEAVSFTWRAGSADTWRLTIHPAPNAAGPPVVDATVTEPAYALQPGTLPPGAYDVALTSCRAGSCAQGRSRQQVVIGLESSAPRWDVRDWSADFDVAIFETAGVGGSGSPLDVVIDGEGVVWMQGEFGSALVGASDTTLTKHDTRLRWVTNPETGRREPVRPYQLRLLDTSQPSPVSALTERVVDTGSAIWFSHGGMFLGSADGNHSRLFRLDKDASDDPSTVEDERLCAVHVPGDRNEVVGLAHDGTRVWFAEMRPGRRSAVGWFIEDARSSCDNGLDYSDPAAVRDASARNSCATNPDDRGCIHEILLPEGAGLASHLTLDPSGDVLWATLGEGGKLARVSIDSGDVEVYPLPAPVRPLEDYPQFAGFPWQLRADDDAVYIGEYSDTQLLRFDKQRAATDECTVLDTNGRNPCIDELFLPMAIAAVNQHSLDLVDGKLWFTLTNEFGPPDPRASTLGYVDTASWAAGHPEGVIYTGMESLGSPPWLGHGFRGIDVDDHGVVALADMRAGAIVRLQPRDDERVG